MKKLLMLGGADIQMSAICQAKQLGYWVITCDYLPNNPGHQISDEYYNISTTNHEAVLELATRLAVDGISSYASDPGALTAAHVADKLGIPGNPLRSIQLLSDKLEFRKIQAELGLSHPKAVTIDSVDDIARQLPMFHNSALLKPADTSGSKGIFHINHEVPESMTTAFIKKAFSEGMEYSRSKRMVLEEFIPRSGFLMSGDFIISEGKILFGCFGDVHFNSRINGIVPRSISLPSSKSQLVQRKALEDLQTIVDRLQITTGVFNADVMETQTGEVMIIDIGARNGGNMFNDIIHYHSGVNLIELSMRQCVGERVSVAYDGRILGYFAHNVIHAEAEGVLDEIVFSDEISPLIIFKSIQARAGDDVKRFVNSSFRLGLILLKFNSFEEMHRILKDINQHVIVKVKTQK